MRLLPRLTLSRWAAASDRSRSRKEASNVRRSPAHPWMTRLRIRRIALRVSRADDDEAAAAAAEEEKEEEAAVAAAVAEVGALCPSCCW